jgi:Flp pilus assembly protein protease CpaA
LKDNLIVLSLIMMGVVMGAVIIDQRNRRIPNWLTMSTFALGVILHFPANIETWVGCFLVISAWRARMTGGGDAKLWIALLWLTPTVMVPWSLVVFGGSMLLTGLGQKLLLHLRHIEAKPGPAAWRALPYALWVLATLLLNYCKSH